MANDRAGRQRTLGAPFTLSGIGVHSGCRTQATVTPAEIGHGIRFLRSDLEGSPAFAASLDNVLDTRRGTTLAPEGDDGPKVGTVEHLLAALYAARIDNALVSVRGPELPIRDGSFLDFADAVSRAGLREQAARAAAPELTEVLAWSGPGGQRYTALPAPDLELAVSIEFDHPLVGRQSGYYRTDREAFRRELAPARTFGFRRDADRLRRDGLVLGASKENSVILGEAGDAEPKLRFHDEMVRHKAGDLMGDLALLGLRLRAKILAHRPGHAGNVAFARELSRALARDSMGPKLDIVEIMKHLPHRYPMLLVDRVTEFEPGKRIVGVKNVSINESFFQGHYPGHPVMPGVLIVEAMAQVGGLLLMDQVEHPEDKVVYFMSLDKVRWRRPVVPGDVLVFELELISFRGRNCRMKGTGFVEGRPVAQAELKARIVDR